MKTRKYKKIVPILLTVLLAMQIMLPVFAQTDGRARVVKKSEVVYGKLDFTGNPQGVYVVNGFEILRGGTLIDYGRYAGVANLITTDELTLDGETVTVEVEAGNFYYQGNLENAQLPWIIGIGYTLDGRDVSPPELAGESGALEIIINISENPEANPVFYENYMMQISVTLNPDICADIEAEKGTMANAGTDRVIAFTHMPGKDAQYNLTAQVSNFSMPAMEISAVPFGMSFDLPDTGEMMSEMTLLSDALIGLNDGVGQMADGMAELDDGVGEFASGIGDLHDGTARLSEGARQLSEGAKALAAGSAAYNEGMKQFSSGASAIEGGSEQILEGLGCLSEALDPEMLELIRNMDLEALGELPAALYGIADSLDVLIAVLDSVSDGSSSVLGDLDSAIAAIPDYSISQESIDLLYRLAEADPSLAGAVDQLMAFYSAGKSVKEAYGRFRPSLESVFVAASSLTGELGAMAAAFRQSAAALEMALEDTESLTGILELTGQLEDFKGFMQQYREFHDGISQLAGGLSEASSAYYLIHLGVVSLSDGAAQLADGVEELNGGVGELEEGAGGLHEGTGKMRRGLSELHAGTQELADAVGDLPEEIEIQIDDLMSDYDKSDFDPVSFVSPRNRDVNYVQFVFMTPAIKLDSEDGPGGEEEDQETLLDRLLALFGF